MPTFTRLLTWLGILLCLSSCAPTALAPTVAPTPTATVAPMPTATIAPTATASAMPARATAGVARPSPTPWPTAPAADYWPTTGWRASTPEAQGMDAAALATLVDAVQANAAQGLPIDSILVVRHGYLAFEAYFPPYKADQEHELASVTKSFTSALVGIAMNEGKLKSLDQRVVDFFPDLQIANLSAAKEAMTLRALLTMRTGMAWSEMDVPLDAPTFGGTPMSSVSNWVQYILGQPMAGQPGQQWNYNSGASHLLAAILQRATGQTEAEYARERLFAPLGIQHFTWLTDPQGISMGYANLRLRPRDMAKFGYLYLHGGRWEDKQVVPAAWVAASTQPAPGPGTAYGYQFWIDPGRAYYALGMAGQLIWVDPSADLVVVVNSTLPGSQAGLAQDLITRYVLPAIRGEGPLPPNPDAQARLAAALDAAQHPRAQAMPPLPPVARQISGRTYTLDKNNLGWSTVSLDFAPAGAAANLGICEVEACWEQPVGLDGLYLTGAGYRQALAERGNWAPDGSFQLQQVELGTLGRLDLTFTFAGDAVQIAGEDILTGQTNTVIQGRQEEG